MRELVHALRERSHDPRRRADAVLDPAQALPPPVSAEQLARAGVLLGFALPALLRSLYLEVGNGGFGPGYGLARLPQEPTADDLVGLYWHLCADPRQPDPNRFFDSLRVQALPAAEDEPECDDEPGEFLWDWPRELVPIFMHGCGAYECIRWTEADGPVILHDPDVLGPGMKMADSLTATAPTLEERLGAWLAGDDVYERAKQRLSRLARDKD